MASHAWGPCGALFVFVTACGPAAKPERTSAPEPSSAPEPGPSCPSSPAAKASFYTCASASDEVACKAAHGNWKGFARMSGGEVFECDCRVTDEGCPCRTAKDCEESCIVRTARDCKAPFQAACGKFVSGDCRVDAKGQPDVLFVDK